MPSRYCSVQAITTEDGLANNRVYDIVLDAQEYLWTSSSNGLQVYDGKEFSALTAHQSERDRLVFVEGYGVFVLSTDHIIRYPSRRSAPDTIVAYDKSLSHFRLHDSARPTLFSISTPDQVIEIDQSLNVRHKDQSAKNQISSSASEPYYIESDKLYKGDILQYEFEVPSERVIYQYHHEGRLVRFTENHVFIQDQKHVQKLSYPSNFKIRSRPAVLPTQQGKLIVGMRRDLYELDIIEGKWSKKIKNLLKGELFGQGNIDKIISDRYGNYYIITVNEGILKLYQNQLFGLLRNDQADDNFVKSICVDEESGKILTAGLHNGITVYDSLGNTILHVRKDKHKAFATVDGIYKTGLNQYLIYNRYDTSLYPFEVVNNTWKLGKPVVTGSGYYDANIRLSDDRQWIFNGMFTEINKGRINEAGAINDIVFCAEFVNDQIYLGQPNRILVLNDKAEFLDTISLSKLGYVRCLSQEDDEHILFGCDQGLFRYNINTHTRNSLYNGCVYSLEIDDHGHAWFGTDKGLMKLSDDVVSQYILEDGIQGLEFNTNGSIKDSQGNLYFAGINGTNYFNPDSIRPYEDGYEVIVSEIKINNSTYTSQDENDFKQLDLSHDENSIEISIVPRGGYRTDTYNYQYYIKGAGGKWIDNDNSTRISTTLAPGKYEIGVSARKVFDDNAVKSALLSINISKPWWQSWPFYIVSSLLVLGLINYLIQQKQKRKYLKKKHEWNLKHELQEERLRISRDLHDNIGSQLTYMVSSLDNLRYHKTLDDVALSKIDNVNEFGRQTIEELRNTIWTLKKDKTTLGELESRLSAYINRCNRHLDVERIRYQGNYQLEDQSISSANAIHIFRIVQEAMQNAIKHTDKGEIVVSLSTKSNYLSILIKDSGKGFSAENKHGYGLNTIRDRAKMMKADLDIQSDQNGTMVQVDFPLAT